MPVTLKDIAQRVGKSVPTVSRALGDFKDISLETRREVQRVAREMGYEPSAAARSLRKRQADTITLILPTTRGVRFSDPFFSEFLAGLVDETVQQGFGLSVSSESDSDEYETYLKHIRSRCTDGFILIRTQRQDGRIGLLQQYKIPFVAFGRVEDSNDFYLVDEDGTYGIRQVVDHLVALGHTRMAFIAEPLHYTKAYHRFLGYQLGLQAHGIPFDPDLVVESSYRQPEGRISAATLLDLPHPPTAIIASNDLLALGAISEAQSRGLVVGHDISVTGFDDILLAEYAHPALTTVHQPAYEFGTRVASMLIQIIRKEPVDPRQVIIQPKLVIRESSGPCP